MSDLEPVDIAVAEVICGEREASCNCVREVGHDGPHACDPVICGGSWTYDADGNWQVVSFPHLGLAADPFNFLFGL